MAIFFSDLKIKNKILDPCMYLHLKTPSIAFFEEKKPKIDTKRPKCHKHVKIPQFDHMAICSFRKKSNLKLYHL